MKKILVFIMLSLFGCSVLAETVSSRYNTTNYYLGGYAIHTIYTDPIKPKQPVFSWRNHTNFDGTPGIHTQNGKLIGYTDNNGVLNVVVERLPFNPVHCGWFRNERVSVGSKYSQKSNSLSFTITVGVLPGPLPPWRDECINPAFNSGYFNYR